MTIRVLPEELASRIAAGEVIERPASALKELVENSLDAGAKRISVACTEGGKERLVVEDDGGGISPADLSVAIQRHATSKIATLEDLENIHTLGFRGEALASLAAVSELEIRSRRRDARHGSLIRISGNVSSTIDAVPCDFGTRVQVDRIFYNLPARRKFLKSVLSEFRKCHSVLTTYAVAYPNVEFLMTNEGKNVFFSKAAGERRSVFECVWGRGDIRTATFEYGSVAVEAWRRPEPEKSRTQILSYVNGRVFADPMVRAAIARVCHDPSGQWAFFIGISPELVDVNIHPAKTEVRFLVPGDVFEAIRSVTALLVREEHSFPIPSVPAASLKSVPFSPGNSERVSAPERSLHSGDFFSRREPSSFFSRVSTPWKQGASIIEEPRRESVRFLAENLGGYLVFEDGNDLVLMDPHAAQERVLYEKYRNTRRASSGAQGIIVSFPLPPSLSLEIEENIDALTFLGFDFERKDGEVRLKRTPAGVGGSPESTLRAALEAIECRAGKERDDIGDIFWRSVATIACHDSLPLGNRFTEAEACALWFDLARCDSPSTCPHGRPTTLRISGRQLSEHFGREK